MIMGVRSLEDQRPTVGRIVHYTLTSSDASRVMQRRNDILGPRGNDTRVGDVYPLIITRIWGNEPSSAVNGQVMLDGNDSLWVTSVTPGVGEGHYAWPPRVP